MRVHVINMQGLHFKKLSVSVWIFESEMLVPGVSSEFHNKIDFDTKKEFFCLSSALLTHS